MHLYDLPLVFALIGLVLYTVLAGADFGAGLWQLVAGRGEQGARIRDHAHDAIGPVWEANHVWLIFVLTVVWTAYPVAFGSLASTLALPLSVAAGGIILRGAAYALRAGAAAPLELGAIDLVFSLSSIITPFALGAAVGGIASRRVPVGNAAGDLWSSWINPTSIVIGVLAVATTAYMSAVFLAADARRVGKSDLQRAFRRRALVSGGIAGAIALAGLAVMRTDATRLYDQLVGARSLPALVVSILAGLATMALVWRGRVDAARYSAAFAVAAIIAGWALAQQPTFLPGLSVEQAAAPQATQVAVIIAVLAGGVILFPSMALLLGLVLRGRLDHAGPGDEPVPCARALLSASAPRLLARLAAACLLAGIGFLTLADAGWATAVGVAALFAFIVIAFPAALPPDLGRPGGGGDEPGAPSPPGPAAPRA